MLCEALACLIVKRKLVGKQQVIDATEGVIETKQGMAEAVRLWSSASS